METIGDLIARNVSIDATLTDPPYCSCCKNGKGLTKYFNESTAQRMEPIVCDDISAHALILQTRLWMRLAFQATTPGGYFFCFSDFRQLPIFTALLEQAGFKHRGIIVWDKKNARPQKGGFTQSSEFITWGTKGRPMTDKVLPGIYRISPRQMKDRLHPTEKPVELLREILKILPEGKTVLDPFMGSGSTGEAAAAQGLNFVGCEISPAYFQVAKKRLGIE